MSSATLLTRRMPIPARASRIAMMVVSFGTSGSKGSAFSVAMRVSSIRMA